ncbi:MAG: preprotein translocase subunit SecG [Actinobacteria bacterium]|nr:preprotein translocase subunit SecG [Actinomycetota bacterium]MCL6104466.1 preprotein translocase subunit SecG [Actinomycetota bacterium]
MLTVLLIIVELIVASGMIFLILLHSGRGGGMSDMFGGGMGSMASGSSVAERNLDRLTILCGLIFVFNTLALSLRFQ